MLGAHHGCSVHNYDRLNFCPRNPSLGSKKTPGALQRVTCTEGYMYAHVLISENCDLGYCSIFAFYRIYISSCAILKCIDFRPSCDLAFCDASGSIIYGTMFVTSKMQSERLLVSQHRSRNVYLYPNIVVGTFTCIPTSWSERLLVSQHRGQNVYLYPNIVYFIISNVSRIPPTLTLHAIRSKRLCYRCLGNHAVKTCRSQKSCRVCNRRHHSTIHEHFAGTAQSEATQNVTSGCAVTPIPGTKTSEIDRGQRLKPSENGETAIQAPVTSCTGPGFDTVPLETGKVTLTQNDNQATTGGIPPGNFIGPYLAPVAKAP
jgi:hypothetical protein